MANSSSTQHKYSLTSSIEDQFDNTIQTLKSLHFLLNETMSVCASFETYHYGISILLSQELDDLISIRKYMVGEFDRLTTEVAAQSSRHLSENDKDIRHHILCMLISVQKEANPNIMRDDFLGLTSKYYEMLIEKLDGESELLIVGSLFPWLEMQIRKDFGVPITEPTDKKAFSPVEDWIAPKKLRDEFIAEKLQQGFSMQHISQALNIRVSAIEKAMAKLTEKDQQSTENAAA